MTSIKIAIKGNYQTGNVVHQYFLPEINPVPSMDILKEVEALHKIFDEFNDQNAMIVVRASLGSGVYIDFDLKITTMLNGGSLRIEPDKSNLSLINYVDAEFLIDIDSDNEKQLKKAYSKSSLKFYITRIGVKKETLEPYSFTNLFGVISGGDWDNDDSWPAVFSFESDIFKKKASIKVTPFIKIPVKANTEIVIDKDKLEAVAIALNAGIVTRVGLSIPGGGNSFFVKQEDWLGKAKFSIKENLLIVDIDAFINLEIDSWMKKYKSKSPFSVELECILDCNSEIHYFGIKGESGYFNPIKAGEVSL